MIYDNKCESYGCTVSKTKDKGHIQLDNIQHTTYNIQHTTYNIQHTTYNIQHTTYNIPSLCLTGTPSCPGCCWPCCWCRTGLPVPHSYLLVLFVEAFTSVEWLLCCYVATCCCQPPPLFTRNWLLCLRLVPVVREHKTREYPIHPCGPITCWFATGICVITW